MYLDVDYTDDLTSTKGDLNPETLFQDLKRVFVLGKVKMFQDHDSYPGSTSTHTDTTITSGTLLPLTQSGVRGEDRVLLRSSVGRKW